jgi:hypothetical protein
VHGFQGECSLNKRERGDIGCVSISDQGAERGGGGVATVLVEGWLRVGGEYCTDLL